MAECIIVIGIVGLVAALTLPTLISNHNKNVYTNQLKKAYSNLANAYKMQVNGVPIDEYCSYVSQDDCTRALAKVLKGTDILLTGLQTERLATTNPLMFTQNLLSTVNSAFIPAAYAYGDTYGGGFTTVPSSISSSYSGSYSLYYNGSLIANCTAYAGNAYVCTNSNGTFTSYTPTGFNANSSIISGTVSGGTDIYGDTYGTYGDVETDSYDTSYDSSYDSYYDSYDSYDTGNDGYDDYNSSETPSTTNNTFYQYKTTPTGLSGKESYFTNYSNTTAIRTKDNTVYFFANGGKDIFIDVNATKRGPNTGGRDIFYFQKLDRDNTNPTYRIKPYDGGEGYTCDKNNVSIGCTQKLLSEGKMNY